MSLSIEAESVLAFLKHADQMRSTFTRDQLVSRTHCSDRTVRAAIQELRAAGHPVWSDPTRAGYRLARSWDEVEALADRFERTGRTHLLTASRLRKRYAQHAPPDRPAQESLL